MGLYTQQFEHRMLYVQMHLMSAPKSWSKFNMELYMQEPLPMNR